MMLSRCLPAERLLLVFVVHGWPGSAEALAGLTDEDVRGLLAEPAFRVARALAPHTKITPALLLSALANGNCALVEEAASYTLPADFPITPLECAQELRRRRIRARMAEVRRRLPGATGGQLDALLAETTRLAREARAS